MVAEPVDPDPLPADDELLDALPYGIIALGANGTILRANTPARELVPDLGTAAVRSCRDLFSCRTPDGPCERGCFVARVSGTSEPAPEIRIDTPDGTLPGALWVTSSPLPGGRGAVLHLRAGARGDRRRRSGEVWQAGPDLRIYVLGRTHVEALKDSLEAAWLSQRPGQILKYLVTKRARVVMVDEIAESIWPDTGLRAISNTRYAIHRLRLKLEPRRSAHGPPTFVVAQGGGYALDRRRIWIDVDEFESAIERSRVALGRLDSVAATQHLERAMELYRGAFLADEPYADWAGDERNRLAVMAIYALRLLTALARDRNDEQDALRHLRRWAELEPLDSGVHRELVQSLLGDGQRGDAKRRYATFARRLRREMGEEPDFDMRSLARQLADRDESRF